MQSHLLIPRKGMEMIEQIENSREASKSHLLIPRKGMETSRKIMIQLNNKQSHLLIPRKGMETYKYGFESDFEQEVALTYSPQGDGNDIELMLLSGHIIKIVALTYSPQGDGNYHLLIRQE